jgi:regulation of enolase protein 1 (concanavalin A-like superfamily)
VLTFAEPTLAGSLRYFYRVSALDSGNGVSAPSIVVSAVNRPSAVTNLTVTPWTTSAIILNWHDTDGETGYRIERQAPGGSFTSIGTTGPNVPSFTDSLASAGTTYTYRVVPLSAQGDGQGAITAGTARLAAVTGFSFVEVLSNKITFRWDDLPNETGYRIERSTDGENWSTLTNIGPGATQYSDLAVSQFRTFYYRVMGTAGAAIGVYPTPLIAATPATNPLPAPWLSSDIGMVPGRGATSSSSPTTFNMLSIGDNIEGGNDQFRFTYQPITGDGQIIARVSSVENTDGSALAGVMIRESLVQNIRHASIFVSPEDGIQMIYRSAVAGSATTIAGSTTTKAPVWLRMTRTGSILRGSTSSDGVNWTDVGSVTISMNATVYVGLAASSYDSAKLGSSAFTNVQVSPAAVLSSSFERPNKLSVTFSGDVGASLAAADLLIESVPAGTSVSATAVSWNAGTRIATFTLPTLSDGNYRARLLRTNVRDSANYALAADFTYDFFVLTGDANGDRNVDDADFAVLYANRDQTGRTFSQGDFNLDGSVDFKDFQILELSFGNTLPAPAAELIQSSTADELLRTSFSTRPIRPAAPKPVKRIISKAR